MNAKLSLLAISGSICKGTAGTAILRTIADHAADKADITLVPLADIPLYNADDDGERMPDAVRKLKQAVAECDGLVVISPEYNYGVSGVLKNAIDWISRPAYASPLKGKPVLLMTASPAATGGVRAQQQLRDLFAATLSRGQPVGDRDPFCVREDSGLSPRRRADAELRLGRHRRSARRSGHAQHFEAGRHAQLGRRTLTLTRSRIKRPGRGFRQETSV